MEYDRRELMKKLLMAAAQAGAATAVVAHTNSASAATSRPPVTTTARPPMTLRSDRRLKKNIVRIGELAEGLGVYAYDYVWPAPRQIGVMADEVRKFLPDAVVRGKDGYDMVDYGKVIAAFA